MSTTAGSVSPIPRRQFWLLAALTAFFLLLSLQYVLKIQNSRDNRSAFLRWNNQLVELRGGVNIWEKHNYPNPPIMALLLLPFTWLSPMTGAIIWFYAKVAMAILSVHWVCRMLDRPERPFPWWGQVLTLLLSLRAIQGDLIHGNVNLFILFLTVGSLFAFTRGRDIVSGLVLALAIACKITPGLFVPYFLWKRAWKTTAVCGVGLALFFFLIPAGLLEWDNNLTYLASWKKVMVEPYLKGDVWSEHNNQSLPGVFYRMLSESPSFTEYVNDIKQPVEYHNVTTLDKQAVGWLIKVCMGLFAMLVLWKCRTSISERTNWRLVAEFGIVCLGMLLFSERTWKHHCVTLLVPFGVLVFYVSTHWQDRPGRWVSIGALAGATLLMTLTSTGLSDGHDDFGKLAQVYGAYFWAFVMLTGALVVLLGRNMRKGQASPILPLEDNTQLKLNQAA